MSGSTSRHVGAGSAQRSRSRRKCAALGRVGQRAVEQQVPDVLELPLLGQLDGRVLAVVVEALLPSYVADLGLGNDQAFQAWRRVFHAGHSLVGQHRRRHRRRPESVQVARAGSAPGTGMLPPMPVPDIERMLSLRRGDDHHPAPPAHVRAQHPTLPNGLTRLLRPAQRPTRPLRSAPCLVARAGSTSTPRAHQRRSPRMTVIDAGQAPGTGYATGLRCPSRSTARSPKWTLSLTRSMVTVVTSPTGMTFVQSGAVVSRHSTS